jgi:hypothetical protein
MTSPSSGANSAVILLAIAGVAFGPAAPVRAAPVVRLASVQPAGSPAPAAPARRSIFQTGFDDFQESCAAEITAFLAEYEGAAPSMYYQAIASRRDVPGGLLSQIATAAELQQTYAVFTAAVQREQQRPYPAVLQRQNRVRSAMQDCAFRAAMRHAPGG